MLFTILHKLLSLSVFTRGNKSYNLEFLQEKHDLITKFTCNDVKLRQTKRIRVRTTEGDLMVRLHMKKELKEGEDGWKKREEGNGDISSCCTGSSSPIDVNRACTQQLSTSYQHRWAARSVPQQEKIQDNCSAVIVLPPPPPPPHFSQTLTFWEQTVTAETIPTEVSVIINWKQTNMILF